MSAPLAGKFHDHYTILGVEPGADSDAIQIAYIRMQEKYGAGGIDDDKKLELIHTAYETLSDPELRKEFDKVKGVSRDSGQPKFMGMEFFDVLGREVGLRGALLSILYDRRRSHPFTPALSMRHLENMLHASIEALGFALWYLKQRGFVGADDKSSLQITVAGMDFLEQNRPKPEDVMPFIKLTAILAATLPESPGEIPAPQPTAPQDEPPQQASSPVPAPIPLPNGRAKLDVRRMLARGSQQ